MGRRARVEGKCRVCGCYGKLSREHMPPEKAFNNATILLRRMQDTAPGSAVRWKSTQSQGGFAQYVLCEKCNNNLGSWYAAEYVRLVREAADFATETYQGREVELALTNVRPLKILKQVFVLFCTSCGDSFVEAHEGLRAFLLSKCSQGVPRGLRILPYLRCQRGGRSTGVTAALGLQSRGTRVVAEFSWWPIGWLLVFEDCDLHTRGQDICEWAAYRFSEKTSVHLKLPVHWTPTAFPMDFRTPEQYAREVRDNELFAAAQGSE